MRPASILLFERLYLAAWAIGVANTVLTWDSRTAQLAANPQTAALGPGLLYAVTAIALAIPLILWFFVARQGSAIAKWIVVVLLAIGGLSLAFAAVLGRYPGGIAGIAGLVTFAMQAAAAWALFRPDSRAWFGESAEPSEPVT